MIPRDGKKFFTILATACLLFLGGRQAWAKSFEVNSILDETDAVVGDGQCASATGVCSLRAAIQEANKVTTEAITIHLPGGETAPLTYSLTVPDATINGQLSDDNNAATGDLDVKTQTTLLGTGNFPPIVKNSVSNRVFQIRPGGNATMEGISVQGGDATLLTSPRGGGIQVDPAGTVSPMAILTLKNVFISGNKAKSGGGIRNEGTLTILNSTISGNEATLDNGGGIEQVSGSLVIVNSTLFGNKALTQNSSSGGGIYFNPPSKPSTVVLKNVTLSGNDAQQGGGISGDPSAQAISLKNTLIGANKVNGQAGASGADCKYTLLSLGYNLIQMGTKQQGCTLVYDKPELSATDVMGQDPLVGPLTNNGGLTLTLGLDEKSPALDAGDPTGCTNQNDQPLSTDQRGLPRPLIGLDASASARCDIGSFELNLCGNGVKNASEECDLGAKNNDQGACTTTCKNMDQDNDGFLSSATDPSAKDCDDSKDSVHPGAKEVCNGADDNCNGQIDEDFTTLGASCTVGKGECQGNGSIVCSLTDPTKTTCDTSKSPGKTAQTEVCDGKDNDCNGDTDEGLGQTTCGVGVCQVIVENCKDGKAQTCTPDESQKKTEVCGNDVDEDCDGTAQVCPVSVAPPATTDDGTTAPTAPTTPTTTPTTPSPTPTTTETVSTSGGGGCSLIR